MKKKVTYVRTVAVVSEPSTKVTNDMFIFWTSVPKQVFMFFLLQNRSLDRKFAKKEYKSIKKCIKSVKKSMIKIVRKCTTSEESVCGPKQGHKTQKKGGKNRYNSIYLFFRAFLPQNRNPDRKFAEKQQKSNKKYRFWPTPKAQIYISVGTGAFL